MSNLYITGKFVTSIKIGDTTLTEPNNRKAFYVAKLDSAGRVQWVKSQSGSATAEVEGRRVRVDKTGNVYVGSKLKGGGITFGGNALEAPPSSGENGFVVKYAQNGALIWAKTIINGTTGKTTVDDIAVDSVGNMHVVGKFEGTATVGNTTTRTLTSAGSENFYVAKLDSAGKALWAFAPSALTGTNKNGAKAVKIDPQGAVYAVGDFDTGIGFDASGNFNFTNAGKNSWVAKWTGAGVLTWVKTHIGATASDEFRSDGLAVDNRGDVLATGKFTRTITIGTLPAVTAESGKNTDLVKYTTAGVPVFLRAILSASDIEGKSIEIDAAGKSIICGSFRANATLIGAGTLTYGGSLATKNLFIARHASSMFVGNTSTRTRDLLDAQLNIFPNPTTDFLTLEWQSATAVRHVAVHDAAGRAVYAQPIDPSAAPVLRVGDVSFTIGYLFFIAER
ncbi:MAG: hypothetical protein U5L45_11800 [Saprospiraceae bacterium]|nr:hypothetical protein [Saprospiraceae bacterium]